MRGILMMLGVVLHSALVFEPNSTWLIHSTRSTYLATLLVDFIHSFRMPAFFIISGFFCLLSIRKHGIHKFLILRCERILVPLIVSVITLNSIQAFFLDRSGWHSFVFNDYIVNGNWISHLWFLYYLICYFVLVFVFFNFKKFIPLKIYQFATVITDCSLFWLIILAFPLFNIILLILGKIMPVMYSSLFGEFTIFDFVYFSQFFICGLLLCWSNNFLNNFIKLSPIFTIALLFAMVIIFNITTGCSTTYIVLLHKYSQILVVWLSCVLCFYIFRNFADKPSKLLLLLSNASYTVFLFHHVLVVAVGLLLIKLNIGGILGMATLNLIVLSISVLIHILLVSKSNFLSYLFNGKKTADAAQPIYSCTL